MQYFPPALENLVEQFAKLPGVGVKSAQRLAFYVLSKPDDEANAFAQAVISAKTSIHCCPVCQNLTDGDGPCSICASPKRDQSTICVVADPKDVAAMERSREYQGLYHVLHGVISPMSHVGPDDLHIKSLVERVAEGEVLPDDDQQADLYLWTVGRLARAGYPQYEISNFAKPGFESRHNLRYWLTRPYIGFGPGAHSDFGGRRYSFVRDLDAYIDGVLHGGNVIDSSELIPQRERCGEYLMLRLRTTRGIDGAEYRRNYFMDFAPLEARLEQFAAQGWAERDPEGRWHFTPKGFLVSNQLIGDLLDRQEQANWEDLIVRPERGPRL